MTREREHCAYGWRWDNRVVEINVVKMVWGDGQYGKEESERDRMLSPSGGRLTPNKLRKKSDSRV